MLHSLHQPSSAASPQYPTSRQRPSIPSSQATVMSTTQGGGGKSSKGQSSKEAQIMELTSAVEFKEQGNRFYALHKFEEAIACYSRAILRNPNVGTFFTNRALCYLKLGQWDHSIQDCRRALEMDPLLIKGHFFLGQALIEVNNLDDAMKHLQRAQDLAKDLKYNFGDEIAYQLRLARKKKWNQIEDKRIREEIELQSYLNRLIQEDRERILAGGGQQQESDPSSSSSSQQQQQQHKVMMCDKYASEVNAMFSLLDLRRKRREVPDYLCGKISFEILKDPIITPSGITYDRKDIEEHLHRVGHFDPVTRQPLTVDKLIPNLAMKEVVDSFLMENEWANEY